MAGVFVPEQERRTVPPRTVLTTDSEALAIAGAAADDYAEMAVVQSTENARAFLDHVWPGLTSSDPAGLARIAERYALEREPEDVHPDPFRQPSLFITAKQDQVVGTRMRGPGTSTTPGPRSSLSTVPVTTST